MANLKELRNKIGVIQSTRKVTSAMKLVAGVKLKKAEQKALSSREYASELSQIISKIRRELIDTKHELFFGRKNVQTEMLAVFASDKGLCGNFNYVINKETSGLIEEIYSRGRNVKIICIGSKLIDLLKQKLRNSDTAELAGGFYNVGDLFENSHRLAEKIIGYFRSGAVDKVSLVYTKCHSALHRKIEIRDVIPLVCEPNPDKTDTVFEPNAAEVLDKIVPYNIAIQIYQAALESIAGEQSSRMTSMDNATRNADELLSDLTITCNRTRQYNITQELVEVISGASAIAKE
ncbi:MAG: ATP synthase F1 subunit gamma [Holosporaceae bacterium]|jgi:F-type H+-transporting ATPase subunit gamma|nr:ATP synthase F1 subunit gamma [Holosporaceae bacterium]